MQCSYKRFMDHGREDGLILPEDPDMHPSGGTWKNCRAKILPQWTQAVPAPLDTREIMALWMDWRHQATSLAGSMISELQYHHGKSPIHYYGEIYKTLTRFTVNTYIKSFISSLSQRYPEYTHPEGYGEKKLNCQIQWRTFTLINKLYFYMNKISVHLSLTLLPKQLFLNKVSHCRSNCRKSQHFMHKSCLPT